MLKQIELFYVTRFGEHLEGDWVMIFLMTVMFAVIFYVCWHMWVFITGIVFSKKYAKMIVVVALVFVFSMSVWALSTA